MTDGFDDNNLRQERRKYVRSPLFYLLHLLLLILVLYFLLLLLLQSWQRFAINTMSSIAGSQTIPFFSAGLPYNKVSLVQLKDTKDAHKENLTTVFGVMGEIMETTRFFCSNFKESGAM